MLSRTADCIYWMSRQTERAENVARLLSVLYQMSLVPGELTEELLRDPLQITGTSELFFSTGEALNIEAIMRFFCFAPNNPASIFSLLRMARENAHVVRGRITSDMWETINATWLEIQAQNRQSLRKMGYLKFLDWVKERSHLFRGVTFGTMRRGDSFHFSRLGTFLERADNTARILMSRTTHVQKDDVLTLDYYQWSALLRSLSAFESYHEIYREGMTLRHISDMLILREDMPRSLHACLNEITQVLDHIEGQSGIDAQRLAAEMHARLHFSRINTNFTNTLNDTLQQFLNDTQQLGSLIHLAYLEAA